MCPFRAGYKISATCGKLHAVLYMLCRCISVPSACLGKNLRSKVFHCAELRDGTRDSVLALKIHTVLHMQSCGVTALFEYFEYFVVSPSTLAVLYMLRRCVGFSWAQPLCYEKLNASPSVLGVKIHMQSFTCSPAHSRLGKGGGLFT